MAWKSNVTLTNLHPDLQLAVKALGDACDKAGLDLLITSGLRGQAEQDALYAQGRTTKGSIITNTSYPKSMHNWGVAVDFCKNIKEHGFDDISFFESVAKLAKPLGLDWGGDWTSLKDMPHLQLRSAVNGQQTPSSLMAKYGTPSAYFKTWKTSKNTTGGIDMPTLKKGSTDEKANRILQLLLNYRGGYDLPGGKSFADKTDKAAKDWQKKNGLTVDGIVGERTWLSLIQ